MNYRNFTLITADSRKVVPGALFIAVKGYASDGHDYIQSAIDKGATGIICEHIPEGASVPSVQFEVVENSRKAMALAADEFYGHPSRKLTLVGITGTNGKTTTVTLLYNLFRGLGYKCGLLSTIANYVGDERLETENTTVDPITLNSLLARMVEEGCQYCFMEVSSIGVEQDRVTGLNFAMGIFSNLTHDHLPQPGRPHGEELHQDRQRGRSAGEGCLWQQSHSPGGREPQAHPP